MIISSQGIVHKEYSSPDALFSNLLYLLIKETLATDLSKNHTKVIETAYIFASSNLWYTTIHAKNCQKYQCLLDFCTDLSYVTATQGTHPALLWLQPEGRKWTYGSNWKIKWWIRTKTGFSFLGMSLELRGLLDWKLTSKRATARMMYSSMLKYTILVKKVWQEHPAG